MGYFDKPWWSPAPWGYSGLPNNQNSNPFADGTGLGDSSGRQQADAGSGGGGGGFNGGPAPGPNATGGMGSSGGFNNIPISGTGLFGDTGPSGGGGNTGGGGGGGGGDAAGPYVSPLGPAPTFNAPQFKAPTGADVLNDPGYQFRLNQGTGALQASAAAKGVLRSGQTLGDIVKYGSDYASNEYGNAYNRALQSYGTQYQGAKDEYAPRLADWNRQWDIYQFSNPTWGEAHRPPQQQIIPDFPDFVAPSHG